MASSSSWSLTKQLLASDPTTWKEATQAPFLRAAAEGRLSKQALGTWLANDRLYIHAYVKSAGRLLSRIQLPQVLPESETVEMQLVNWICDALAGAHREERWFIDATKRYGLQVDLETDGSTTARVKDEAKLRGLLLFERLFGSVVPLPDEPQLESAPPCPWLEGAVILWGTEKVYLEAWSWAKGQLPEGGINESELLRDADGGAARKEFIGNWSSPEFAEFVRRLGDIVDKGARELVEREKDVTEDKVFDRVQGIWKRVLAAEASFWPDLE